MSPIVLIRVVIREGIDQHCQLVLHVFPGFRWSTGTFQGWSRDPASAMKAGNTLDLSPFDSYEELASLGLDRLKSSLQALNLKCGGTLMERAQRLYATKGRSTYV